MQEAWLLGICGYLVLGTLFLLFGPVHREVQRSTRYIQIPRAKAIAFQVVVRAGAVLVWPIFFFMGKLALEPWNDPAEWERMRLEQMSAKPSNLVRQFTIEEVEAAHTKLDDSRVPPIPFGFANDSWQHLKGQIQPGDEIWSFRTEDESWQHLAGRAG
jgi:hypothetical protein